MADTAKVIRIELRVGGSNTTPSEKRERQPAKSKSVGGRLELKKDAIVRKLAGVGTVGFASQLLSSGFSIAETLSYNSEEKTRLMNLDIAKKAVSSSLIAGGYILGGPVGAAVGMAVNEFIVRPVATGGAINIQRNLDQTRATNRFHQTNFAGRGIYTFDYSSGGYVNEDLYKVRNGSFYKKGSVL